MRIRIELEATPGSASISPVDDAIRAASVPIEGIAGDVSVVLVDGSYRVGRRAAFSEFDLFIRNDSGASIYAPNLEVVGFLTRNRKETARGEITTSDNGLAGVGAVFDYGWALGADRRLPGQADSPARRWFINDPATGFEPYVLVLELSYFTGPVEPELPPAPEGEIAEVRGFIDPETNEVLITDLRSPYLSVSGRPDLSRQVTGHEVFEATFEVRQTLNDLFLTSMELRFLDLRFVSNDQNRTVALLGTGANGSAATVALGDMGPGGGYFLDLAFEGRTVSPNDVPPLLRKFEFHAIITGEVNIVGVVTPEQGGVILPGENGVIRLEGEAYFGVADGPPWPGTALDRAVTVALAGVTSPILVDELRSLPGFVGAGSAVRLSLADLEAVRPGAVTTLGLRVTPELAAAAEAGADLHIFELVATRSPNEIYWRPLASPVFPDEVANGWVSGVVNAHGLSFAGARGEAHGFYALVATRPAATGSFALAAAGLPSGDPFLLGPDNQLTVSGDVTAPEAFRVDLLNPLTGEVLRDAELCLDLEGVLPREETLGCVTTEFGDGREQEYDFPARHRGIDLRTNLAGAHGYNHPIFPAADGVVRTATYSDSMGCYVIVDHPGGFSTVYSHIETADKRLPEGKGNCALSVQEGDRVRAGASQLGVSGNTGTSFAPHVHFELLPTGDMNLKTDPRGLGIFNRQYRSELIASIHISYPDPSSGVRRNYGLPTVYHFLEVGGSGGPVRRDRVTVRETITRADLLALVGERPENGLVYIGDAFTWTGRAPGQVADAEFFQWSKQIFDWAVPVGLVGVDGSPVPLAGGTTVFGYGFNPGLSGGNASIDVYFHSAGYDGPSATPNLPGVVNGRSALELSVVVPGPNRRVSDNAAWGTVLVEFRNKRNSTREGTGGDSGLVRILPTVGAVMVVDGVSPGWARGGKTVLVEGSGFLSGPFGAGSLTAGVRTTDGGQGEIGLTPDGLGPLSWSFTTPDHLFSGPATVLARVEDLEGASGEGQLTVYPYILGAPRIGASGDGVVVTGTGLGPEVTVRFNGGSYAAAGDGTSAAVTIGDGIRSGALSVLAGGQASGNGLRFVALPTVTITAVDATTGAGIGADIDYVPVALDNSDQGTYDEVGNRGGAPQRGDLLLGSGQWGYRLTADGYEEASGSLGLLTTTPVELTVPLTPRAPIGGP